jgi:tRNA/tmRNA/rRNA uracil-C5-methylase (TrmA/RlmC/RlmD family)
VEEAVEAARRNAELNGLTNCTFLSGDVFETLPQIPEKPDYVILDPPREGVHEKALRKILDYGISDMVYISCKASSFAEDMRYLKKQGWKIQRYTLVDMFPETQHIETVCLLSQQFYSTNSDLRHSNFFLQS